MHLDLLSIPQSGGKNVKTSRWDRCPWMAINVSVQAVCMYSMYDHTHSKSMDQLGKVASLARGRLNR